MLVLPFLEQAALYQQFVFEQGFASRWNDGLPNRDLQFAHRIDVWMCPSDPLGSLGTARNNYFGCMGSRNIVCTAPNDANRQFFNNGMLFTNSRVQMRDVTDGTSNTFLCGESKHQVLGLAPRNAYSWATTAQVAAAGWPYHSNIAGVVDPINRVIPHPTIQPIGDRDYDPNVPDWFTPPMRGFGSYHVGGCHFLLVDGSVRFVSENVDFITYQDLATRDGREVIGEF